MSDAVAYSILGVIHAVAFVEGLSDSPAVAWRLGKEWFVRYSLLFIIFLTVYLTYFAGSLVGGLVRSRATPKQPDN